MQLAGKVSSKEYKPHTAAIILAAGSGKRMGNATKKQYLMLDGKPLIYYALRAFQNSFVDTLILVVSPGDKEYCEKEIVGKFGFNKVSKIVEGGKERYHSVAAGLNAIETCDYVFIHDGARPLIDEDVLRRAFEGVKENRACVVGMPVKDTIKIADQNGNIKETPNRRLVWMVQTPQVFDFHIIKEAYDKLLREEIDLLNKGIAITDDAMVVETLMGLPVKLVEGSYRNMKITTPEDLQLAATLMQKKE